ncbi:MAG: DUF2306 domain-containing protein [Candidatus Sulfotelmatobacter sp.]
MATSVVVRPGRWARSEVLLGVLLLLVLGTAAKFIAHYAFPYFAFDPAYFDYYWPHRFRLITHISGGMLALICGPFQFWTGLRQKALNIHRWTGLLYLLGVLVGASGAAMMAYFSSPRNFGVSLGFMALAQVLCTAVAYLAILRRQVSLHKEWMVRSYLVTFGFVTFRLISDYPPGVHWGTFADRAATVTWACWVVPLMAYEIVLAARRALAARPV